MASARSTKRIFLAVWLFLPAAAVGLLLYWAAASLSHAPAMSAPAVGAGAGRTGGANAVGELLFGNPADYAGPYNERDEAGVPNDAESATEGSPAEDEQP